MKLGRHLPKVRAALDEAGLLERAIYVERGTMADERICPLAEKTRRRGALLLDDPRARPREAAVSGPARSPSSASAPATPRWLTPAAPQALARRDRSRRLRPLSRPRPARAGQRRHASDNRVELRARAPSRSALAAAGTRASPSSRAAIPASSPWRRRCSRRSRRRSGLARARHRGRARHHGDAGRSGARRARRSAAISAPSRCPTISSPGT